MDARRLGKLPAKDDPRTLMLARYMAHPLPAVPPMMNWGTVVPRWGMMCNDKLGNCTAAAAGHIIIAQTAYHGAPAVLSDDDIVKVYEATGGYVPGDESTDNGAVELDVLNYWRSTGVGGHKIMAYAAIDAANTAMLREAIYLFGCVYAGVRLPVSAQDQNVWAVTDRTFSGDAKPGSWGGHAIPLVGYDTRAFCCVTWGEQKWMTDEWARTYGDEAYALISADWSPPGGVAPNHFDLDQLKADLSAVTQGA